MKALKYILLFLFITITSISYACNCVGNPTINDVFKGVDAAFVGEVINVEKINKTDTIILDSVETPYENIYHIYSFKVKKIYKTNKQDYFEDSVVEIITNSKIDRCGFPFELGSEYIVYAYKEKQHNLLNTHICTRTRLYDKKEIAELNRLTD